MTNEDQQKTPNILWANTHISMISRKQFREANDLPAYMDYKYLCKIANNLPKSHRLEAFVVAALRELGLNASLIPAVADGNISKKEADVLITSEDGTVYALEVKEASYRGCTLGEPVDESIAGANGYERLPRWLWVDSVSAWKAKVRACKQREQKLIGCVVLAPIGVYSDEDQTTLGAVYLPASLSSNWRVAECENKRKQRIYDAYRCFRRDMRTLADLAAEVKEQN